jgi:large subunit ribosomal protein L6
MPRVGRSPIVVPSNGTVTLRGATVSVKGPQGSLERQLPEGITVAQEGDTLVVSRPDDERQHRALHGLSRSLVANMVSGVTDGFSKELEIVVLPFHGQGAHVELALGFHP